MTRAFFLWMGRNRALRRWIEGQHLPRALTRRFVAGETEQEVLEVCQALWADGYRSTLDHLGESTTAIEEANAACDVYIRMMDAIQARDLPSTVAIKLTQFGLDISEEACQANVNRLVAKAGETSSRVEIDMERSDYTERTVSIAEAASRQCGCVRVAIQAYLYRSRDDIHRLNVAHTPVRLCKGAYQEPASVAYPKKVDVDRNYVELMKLLLDEGTYPAIASHDPAIIEETLAHVKKRGIGKDEFEFQMLYGIGRELQKRLCEEGYRMRVYVPYGEEWYPYFMRRLAERPANVWFVLRNMFG